jgi:Na+-driven multidrug efflux pump
MAASSTKSGIRGQFVRYAVPSVAGMIVSSLYTVVDGIFVGRGVGDLALGGVNIVFPFIMLVIAVTMLIAIGGANLLSFRRGRNEHVEANNIFNQAVGMLAVASLALFLAAFFFSRELSVILGADEDLLPFSQAYLRTMAPFVAVQTMGLGLSIFLRNDNSPNLAMIGTISGAVANIYLDYLFIMEWGWGIEGAAIATGIGLALELCIYLSHFIRRKGELRFRLPVYSLRDVKKLFYNGAPSFLMEFCQSAVAISFNPVIIGHIGPLGVAAYGIVTYICPSFNMILIGITQGAQPIISLNHGRGNVHNVRAVYRLGTWSGLLPGLAFIGVCFVFTDSLVGLFIGGEGDFVALAGEMLRYFCIGYIPVGLTLMNILFFQTTEQEARSTVVAILRCVGFVQVFLLFLPAWFGVHGIYLSFLCGEVGNWLVSISLMRIKHLEFAADGFTGTQPALQTITSNSARLRRRK